MEIGESLFTVKEKTLQDESYNHKWVFGELVERETKEISLVCSV